MHCSKGAIVPQAGASAEGDCSDAPDPSRGTPQALLLPSGDLHVHSWKHSSTAHTPNKELEVCLLAHTHQNHFSVDCFLERKINSEE